MFVVGFNISSAVALNYDHDEVVRAARAALIYLSKSLLDHDTLRDRLIAELRVFGEFHIEYLDPEGNELEFPDDTENVLIQISTNSARLPTVH